MWFLKVGAPGLSLPRACSLQSHWQRVSAQDSENVSPFCFFALCSSAGSSCRSPQSRPLLLTSAPNSSPAAALALAQGEPKPPGPRRPAVPASPPPRRAVPARPPEASPCPAKRAPPPRTKPDLGVPHLGGSCRHEPSLRAPPPQVAPRKDPEGNSRLSAQQPKAGRGPQKAGPGPDNDARGSLRPPTLAPAPTRSRPLWKSSQHSLTRPQRATAAPASRLHLPGR